MKFENRIQRAKHQFTKTDHKITRYLLNLESDTHLGTIQNLSEAIHVSPSSLSRFIHKLGYESFQSFRFSVQQELQTQHIDNSPSIQVMYRHYMSILNHTSEFIVEADLICLVDAIRKSNKVIFVGIGSSGLSAQELYYRTSRMGLNTLAITDAHQMMVIGHMCDSKTTVIVLTNSGETREILQSIAHGHKSGAEVIAISHFRTPQLERYCSRIIMTVDNKRTHDTQFVNSQLSTHFIIDLISYHLLQDPTLSMHYQKSSEALIALRDTDAHF
ncbi:MurR/RpiR family transcriptional regulator [Staphylococcus canis]|uniref:MurR/RpiR family transcriptional regulator n=1 Tax=Staphylococcus canis TaxID=2724942 RepID=A0ABS0T8J9_9STAP|nr:MurR/RpiR family transcriptional regulator [Staphylococcus canis]MBI5975086.1 MurR/RpiR family transcriptional regulator [Staphylococcus canis]